jgi:hypothetical protein
MIPSVETKLEGTTLIVRIPMRFQRRGWPQADPRAGRQRACARDEAAPRWHTGQGGGAGVAVATDA